MGCPRLWASLCPSGTHLAHQLQPWVVGGALPQRLPMVWVMHSSQPCPPRSPKALYRDNDIDGHLGLPLVWGHRAASRESLPGPRRWRAAATWDGGQPARAVEIWGQEAAALAPRWRDLLWPFSSHSPSCRVPPHGALSLAPRGRGCTQAHPRESWPRMTGSGRARCSGPGGMEPGLSRESRQDSTQGN